MNDQWQTTVRCVLKFLGGFLVSRGYTTDSGWTEVAGAALTIFGFIWGLIHRTPGPAKAGTPSASAEARGGTYVPMLAGCMVLAMLLLPGCVTRPDGTKGPDIARISRLSGTAAQLGSLAWLSKNPGDRAYFATANEALKGLINSGNYDPAAFASALQGLPIKELKGSEGSLYISVAIVVWDEAIQSAQGLDRQELVAATLKAVQQGIERTLNATAPKASLESLSEYPLAQKVQARDGDMFIGVFLGMIAEHDGKGGVMMFSATTGECLRWISHQEFLEVYVLKSKPEYPPTPRADSKTSRYAEVLMPRWRAALQPAQAYALVTFRN